MTWLLDWLKTPAVYLIAGLAFVVERAFAKRAARKAGKHEAVQEGKINAAERVEEGRRAVAAGDRADDDPESRVVRNDSRW